MDFKETLNCYCRDPDLGKRMKQCSCCLDWFNKHYEGFDDFDQNFFQITGLIAIALGFICYHVKY